MTAETKLEPASPIAANARQSSAASGKKMANQGAIKSRAPMVLLCGASVLLVLLAVMNIWAKDSALSGETFAPSIVALIWLGCYLVTSRLAFGTVYLFASAYIVCLFVFHFGLLLQDGFGLINIIDWIGPIGAWAVRAGWYANLALACIGIGFSGFVLRHRSYKLPPPSVTREIITQNFALHYHHGIGVLVASGVLFALAIATQGNIFALTRLDLFHLSDTRFISVFSMMAPSAAIALVVTAQTKRQRLLSYAVAATVLLLFLLGGQRSTALFPLLAGIILWVKSGRRLNSMLAIAMLVGVLLIIPMVGYLRTLGTYGEITTAEAITEAKEYVDIGSAFGEMGGSIGPLMYTLMLIPSEEPYRYGKTYFNYLTDVIPNIGLNPDQSTSRGAAAEKLRSGSTKEALLEMDVGDWASYHIIREQFESGGGAGYSGVAEPYFNFGLVGVLVFFVAMGVFLARFDCTPIFLNLNWLIFATMIFWHLLPTVRNGFAVFTKPAVFTLIVLLIWKIAGRFIPLFRAKGIPRPLASPRSPGHQPR